MIENPRITRFILFPLNQDAIPLVKRSAPIDPVKGHGLYSTKWNGFKVHKYPLLSGFQEGFLTVCRVLSGLDQIAKIVNVIGIIIRNTNKMIISGEIHILKILYTFVTTQSKQGLSSKVITHLLNFIFIVS